jgi:predicted helicase
MGQYEPFEGICFADTLELAEGKQLALEMFVEENTERVKREKDADIMVVIGNPPYNVGQANENDNNKNRRYEIVDKRIKETYIKDSTATNRNALSDTYIKFFRWAVDRLGNRDGIVCFVSNNSFIDQAAFDGMRKHLLRDFTQIYHLDLHGNIRKNAKLSGSTHNVFGIQIGVGITLAVRASHHTNRSLLYHRVPEYWHKTKKLAFLTEKRSIAHIDWLLLEPNQKFAWITEGQRSEFATFPPLGAKEAKSLQSEDVKCIFKLYSIGVLTSRDNWVCNFNSEILASKINKFIDTYNSEIDRWKRAGEPKDIDDFVIYDDTQIKWSRDLKSDLKRKRYAKFDSSKIRRSLYRPFTVKYYFFDPILSQDVVLQPKFFPTSSSESENIVIVVGGYGRKDFAVLGANYITNYNFYGDPAQCFPYYVYSEDGSNRRENITDWALQQFQDRYRTQLTKRDIFHYIYAMLHHPQYRELYKENLKYELPRIPFLLPQEGFEACVSVGKQLMELHVNYEQVEEYPLRSVSDKNIPYLQRLRVEKMKLSADKTALIYSKGLTLEGIPPECFEYRLGNRSALEWVIDQYQVSTDKRSGIESDPNRLDDPGYIVRLLKQVVMVSVKTVELVKELAEAVTEEDWLGESVNLNEDAAI